MSQFRLLALLPLAVAASCYSEGPRQSTLPATQPQPAYISGPPGGAIDPGYGYGQYAGDPSYEGTDQATADNAPVPSETAPVEEVPGTAVPAPGPVDPALASALPNDDDGDGDDGEDVAVAPPSENAPTDPTRGVTNAEIDATLDGYGQWIETDDYGQVWRPDATVVGVDFTPYESGGSWQYTDAGWAFSCDYEWGWLPFHYGRWAWFHDYWGWVPGHRWGPAWVEWRHGGGVVGWRPMSPRIRDHRHGAPNGNGSAGRDHHHGSRPSIRDHRHPEQHDAHWRFATVPDFGRPHVRSHLYGNLAEGLRVTSRVTAPPLRARTTVRAGDLMRPRGSAGGRLTQPGPGRFGDPQRIRDHRSSEPGRAYQPPSTRGTMSVRTQQYNPPVRTPPEAYRPPGRAQPYNPPARTHQSPVRTYQPPARTSTPHTQSAPPARSWSPPPRSHGSRGSSSSSSGSHGSGGSSHHSGSSHSSSGSSHSRDHRR